MCRFHANAPAVTEHGVVVIIAGIEDSQAQLISLDFKTGALQWATNMSGGWGSGIFKPVDVSPGVVALNFEFGNMSAFESRLGSCCRASPLTAIRTRTSKAAFSGSPRQRSRLAPACI